MRSFGLLAACLVVSACNEEHGRFPIQPSGGGNGGFLVPDAAIETDASTAIAGRVCLTADPRSPSACASTGAGGFTVTLGGATAMTAADGRFTIDPPASTNAAWFVSGTGIVPSSMAFAEGTTIPAISTTLYSDMIVAMQATVSSGNGAIIAQVAKTATLVSGAVVTTTPSPDSLVYYDGPSVTEWQQDSTGPLGIAWISSIAPGTGSLTINAGATPTTVSNIPLLAGAITYVFAEIP